MNDIDELSEPEWDEEPGEAISTPSAHTVTDAESGTRLDVLVAGLPSVGSRSAAQRLIDSATTDEGVLVNGARARASYRVRPGDVVTVTIAPAVAWSIQPEQIPLDILFEDADLLVINKPRGMVVHPAPGATTGTLAQAVMGYADALSGVNGEIRPGIVHRLDKDTGGLIIVAKNDETHRALQEQIQRREVSRRYLALVWGVPDFAEATVDAPIGRHPSDRKKMAVITDPRQTSRHAKTDLIVQETFGGCFTLLEARLHTGRTHQIRVHCTYIRHPIVGDTVYGGIRKIPEKAFSLAARREIEVAIEALQGQALHAYSLAFEHPRTGEPLAFRVDLPPVVQNLIDALRRAAN
jgi:23S rRNA pseudouridine1911/1915/1917 synthase